MVASAGKAIAAGGVDLQDMASDSVELWDPATQSWSAAREMHTPREGFSMVQLAQGDVLAMGGLANGTEVTCGECYNPYTNSWYSVPSTVQSRTYFQAVVLQSGKVLVAGGLDKMGVATSSVELFNPDTRTWTHACSMAYARESFQLLQLPCGCVLATGGSSDGGTLATSEVYIPSSNRWSRVGDLLAARSNFQMALLHGKKSWQQVASTATCVQWHRVRCSKLAHWLGPLQKVWQRLGDPSA